MPDYPNVVVKMVGEDGNAFSIIGRVVRELRAAGEIDAANQFKTKAMTECDSYDELLQLVVHTVDVE